MLSGDAIKIDKLPRSFNFDRSRLKRINFHLADSQAQKRLAACRREMANILIRKKIGQEIATKIIEETLFIAASHPVEASRRDRFFENRADARKALDRLIKHLSHVVQGLSRLTPSSQAELNNIISKQDWRQFDTEMFGELISALLNANLSPPRVASQVRSGEPTGQVARLRILWENLPPETRIHVERSVRLRLPKRALKFFRDLVFDLRKHRPRDKRVRHPPAVRPFAARVAKLWQKLGLRVGRSYRGDSINKLAHHLESDFQKFCRLALAAIGNDARVSRRQIGALKAELRRKPSL
jgi:hypothetical protein